ncbi:TrbI/VirB10 family protein [Escherichia coli]|nr:TrbI/VirB10 family protein [Escherichia coli]
MKNESRSNNDVGNRGVIEVKSKKSSKKIFILLASIFGIFVVAAMIIKMLPSKEVEQTGLEPKNETLISNSQDGASLNSVMKTIMQNKQREETERKQREEQAEKEKKQKTEINSDNDSTMQAMAMQGQSSSHSSSQSGNGQEKERPLTKAERQITGDTLVKIETRNEDKRSEKEMDSLQGETYADGTVSFASNRRFLLAAGTSLSCVLQTKIVTSYPGITLCQLTKDLYSDNGETLLARRGAMLMGEQNKVMTQGVARVFVNWTNLKDGNVNVKIGALGTDGLGASGLPAWIDNHIFQRYSGAIMLSLLGDGMDILKNTTQKSGNNSNITYDNTSDTAQELAKTTLENTINIPPTAYINQGTVLSVIVPRNIDFSEVYGVQ